MSSHPSRPAALGRFIDALEERTGLRSLWRWLADEDIPGGARFAFVFGSLLLLLVVVQGLTGALLAMEYGPTTASAHESLARLMDPAQSPWGSLVRSIHHLGASFLVLGLVCHVLQAALFGAYRKPREANWLTGLAAGLLLLAFAFTGYLLPWDQTAYYATRVGLNIMQSTPVAGPALARILQGGQVMGNLTLTRFYTIHVIVLPLLLGAVVAAHLLLFRRHGVTPAPGLSLEAATARAQRFWPEQALRDVLAMLAVVALLVALAHFHPAELGAKADPSQPFEARPEWYFFWLFQLLHFFEPPWDVLGTMVIPGGLLLFFALLPWLDRSPERTWRSRHRPFGLVATVFAGMAVLTLQVVLRDRALKAADAGQTAAPATQAVAVEQVSPLQVGLLYGEKCTECHATDGAAIDPDAKDFRLPEFKRMAKSGFEEMVKYVKQGGDVMPAFADELTDAQIRALLEQVVLAAPEKDVPLHSAQ